MTVTTRRFTFSHIETRTAGAFFSVAHSIVYRQTKSSARSCASDLSREQSHTMPSRRLLVGLALDSSRGAPHTTRDGRSLPTLRRSSATHMLPLV